MLKCAICNKEFNDNQLDEYAAHVQKCAADESIKRKTKELKKINQELEEVKRAKIVYEGLKEEFKKNHPDVYKENFTDVCKGNCKCNAEEKKSSANEKLISSDNSSLKKPINKGNLKTENSNSSINDDDYEFEIDFSDLTKVIKEMFGYDYNKRN